MKDIETQEVLPNSAASKVLYYGLKSLQETMENPRFAYEPKFADNQEGFEKFKIKTYNYLQQSMADLGDINAITDKDVLYPSIEVWCTYMGISRVTLSNYRQRGEVWEKFIDDTKNVIGGVKVSLAESGKINPMVHFFDFCNNYGYYNTTEFKRVESVKVDASKTLTAAELPRLATSNEV